MRAEYEHRKTKELKQLIREEEERVREWRTRMRADIDRKEAEYREWFERKLPEVKAPKIE